MFMSACMCRPGHNVERNEINRSYIKPWSIALIVYNIRYNIIICQTYKVITVISVKLAGGGGGGYTVPPNNFSLATPLFSGNIIRQHQATCLLDRSILFLSSSKLSSGVHVYLLDRFRSRTRTSKTTWKWRQNGVAYPYMGTSSHFHVVFDVRVFVLNLSNIIYRNRVDQCLIIINSKNIAESKSRRIARSTFPVKRILPLLHL